MRPASAYTPISTPAVEASRPVSPQASSIARATTANSTPAVANRPKQARIAIRRAATDKRRLIIEDKRVNLRAGTPSTARDVKFIGSWAVSSETPGFAPPPHDEFALIDILVIGNCAAAL